MQKLKNLGRKELKQDVRKLLSFKNSFQMKVVLKQDVRNLGKKGELVETSDGYARNFLFPRNLAAEADNKAMNELKNAESSKQFKIDTQIKQATASKNKLEGQVFKSRF